MKGKKRVGGRDAERGKGGTDSGEEVKGEDEIDRRGG